MYDPSVANTNDILMPTNISMAVSGSRGISRSLDGIAIKI